MHLVNSSTWKWVLALVFAFLSEGAFSSQLKAINIAPNVEVGVAVSISVEIDITDVRGGRVCGLDIDYGDGTIEEYMPGKGGMEDFPLKVSHIYQRPGNYIVKAIGKTKFRGLGTAMACTGDDIYKAVTVTDALTKKALAAKEAELAEKEAQIARKAAELEQMRQAQITKERELLLKQQQADALTAAKEAATKARATQAPSPVNTSTPSNTGKMEAF